MGESLVCSFLFSLLFLIWWGGGERRGELESGRGERRGGCLRDCVSKMLLFLAVCFYI